MTITYSDSGIEVNEGDIVEYRPLIFFWQKRRGRVSYVPGISKFHAEMESNGLTWLGVSGDDGSFRGIYIDPETQIVKKGVSFIARCENTHYLSPHELKDEEW